MLSHLGDHQARDVLVWKLKYIDWMLAFQAEKPGMPLFHTPMCKTKSRFYVLHQICS